MTLTNPIVERIRRIVDDAQLAGRVPNIRAEAALLRQEYPMEPCLIEEIANALDIALTRRTVGVTAITPRKGQVAARVGHLRNRHLHAER